MELWDDVGRAVVQGNSLLWPKQCQGCSYFLLVVTVVGTIGHSRGMFYYMATTSLYLILWCLNKT